MSTIEIQNGVSTIGNYGDTDVELDSINSNIQSFKTLVNGSWKSWSKGAPEAFQGFTELQKGKGYVCNSSDVASLDISDTDVNVNDIDIIPGLNFLCFPFTSKDIVADHIPRIEANTIKTIHNNWASWSAGAPDAFQGFLNINKDNGYIIDVKKQYETYLNELRRDMDNGARIGSLFMNENDYDGGEAIVDFTPDATFSSIDYDRVPVDTGIAKINMWVKIGEIVKLIKFPQELTGKVFTIKEKLLDIESYGLITEGSTGIINNGYITDAPTEQNDYGDLTGGYLLTNTLFTGVFDNIAGNTEENPYDLSDTIKVSAMELVYNTVTLGGTVNYNKMLIDLNGVKSVLEFADEYIGTPFLLFRNGVKYSGTFTVSENGYINL